MHNPKLPSIRTVLLPTVCPCLIVLNLFDACLYVNEFKNCFCNPLIMDSSDKSLIGLSGHSMFHVNHSLALPLSCVL